MQTLTLVGDTHFDPSAVADLSKLASHVSAHLKGGAVVGMTGVKKVIFGGIKPLYRVPIGVFDDAQSAKAWLTWLAHRARPVAAPHPTGSQAHAK